MLSVPNTQSNPGLIDLKSILLNIQKHQREGNQCTQQTKEIVESLQPLMALLAPPEAEEMQLGASLQNVLAAILDRITSGEQTLQQVLRAQSALVHHQQHMLKKQRAEMQAIQATLDRLTSLLEPVIDAFCEPEGLDQP